MADDITVVWTRALDRYAADLEVPARKKILSITSLEALRLEIGALRAQYAKKTPNDDKALQLAARYSRTLEQIVEVFEKIDDVLPRFESYASYFPLRLHKQLETTLAKYHIELINICGIVIKFYKKHPFRNLLSSPFLPLKLEVAPRVDKLKSLVYNIDQEARWSAEKSFEAKQQANHEETIRILKESGGLSTFPTTRMLLQQTPYCNLPTSRNPAFFGRAEELTRLSSILQPQSPPEHLTYSCIYGLSGAGKTQLALEFAYRNIRSYEAILWVSAETPGKIAQAFTTFARTLELSDPSLQHADHLKDMAMRLLDGPDLPEELSQLDNLLMNPLNEVFTALASLLDQSLIQIDDAGANLQCHRLVRLAVAESMPLATRSSVFNRVVFQLNAAFPSQSGGRPLHDQWHKCERLATQVAGVVESYLIHKAHLDAPILLCEIVARCSWYFYEKGQFKSALELVDKALQICDRATKTSDHPGYSPWFVQDMKSHLINVQATIAREKPTVDNGLHLSVQVCNIRVLNERPCNEEDSFWIATARGNLAVSLMGVHRCQEALDISLDLISRPDMKPLEDIYLCNICLCLTQLDRLDEALTYNDRAVQAIEASKGKETIEMAL
ncbi:hypothetical protein N0V82_006833 [Gnomoniopsis sp. IMI 355080]|nr:hypothetical protein N0V82_006833 [Gnomoniopsis sp. IMI 355080]